MGFIDDHNRASDGTFRAQMAVAIVRGAKAILDNAQSDVESKALAKQALTSPEQFVSSWALACATEAAVAATPAHSTVDDATITAAIAATFGRVK